MAAWALARTAIDRALRNSPLKVRPAARRWASTEYAFRYGMLAEAMMRRIATAASISRRVWPRSFIGGLRGNGGGLGRPPPPSLLGGSGLGRGVSRAQVGLDLLEV